MYTLFIAIQILATIRVYSLINFDTTKVWRASIGVGRATDTVGSFQEASVQRRGDGIDHVRNAGIHTRVVKPGQVCLTCVPTMAKVCSNTHTVLPSYDAVAIVFVFPSHGSLQRCHYRQKVHWPQYWISYPRRRYWCHIERPSIQPWWPVCSTNHTTWLTVPAPSIMYTWLTTYPKTLKSFLDLLSRSGQKFLRMLRPVSFFLFRAVEPTTHTLTFYVLLSWVLPGSLGLPSPTERAKLLKKLWPTPTIWEPLKLCPLTSLPSTLDLTSYVIAARQFCWLS